MSHAIGLRMQYLKLYLLMMVHLLADSAASALPGFLPVAMQYFGFNLSSGVTIVCIMGICCNLLQIPLSRLGRDSASPFWIKFGLILVSCGSLIGLLPRGIPFLVICLVIAVSGIGIAMVHPSGLRGVQSLYGIPAGMTTPVFMTGGFLGCAVAPWLSGILVERFGLKGLLIFFPIVLVVVFLIHISRIRVAVDSGNTGKKQELVSPWSFWALILIATFLNCGSASFSGLVPYMLNVENGFSLSFGGFALFLFGGSSSLMSVYLGWLSSERNVEKLLLLFLFCGIPFSILFFILSGSAWSVIFCLFAGGLCSSVYPIFVAMSKVAPGGYSLGMRMGLMVGGTWGISGIVFLGVGFLASHYSARAVLEYAVPGFYFLSAMTALLSWNRIVKLPCGQKKC